MKLGASQQIPFFVYGTLIPGQPNDHLWLDQITTVETAIFANGKLYDMGFYPMLVEDKGGMVRGKLISVTTSAYREILKGLDALEGFDPNHPSKSSFNRVRRSVAIDSGLKIQCWLYTGRQEFIRKSKEITGGDWVAYAAKFPGDWEDWWKSVDTVWDLHKPVQDPDR